MPWRGSIERLGQVARVRLHDATEAKVLVLRLGMKVTDTLEARQAVMVHASTSGPARRSWRWYSSTVSLGPRTDGPTQL